MLTHDLLVLSQDIARKRVIYNITQLEVATALNVSPATLCRWESANFRSTKMYHLIKLIEYLEAKGVSFDHQKTDVTH